MYIIYTRKEALQLIHAGLAIKHIAGAGLQFLKNREGIRHAIQALDDIEGSGGSVYDIINRIFQETNVNKEDIKILPYKHKQIITWLETMRSTSIGIIKHSRMDHDVYFKMVIYFIDKVYKTAFDKDVNYRESINNESVEFSLDCINTGKKF